MGRESALEFRFDCGAAWLDLLATTGRTFGPKPVERLSSPPRLAEWLQRSELSPRHPPDEEDVALAHRVREIIRVLALAVVDGESPSRAAADELTAFLSAHPDSVRLTCGERLYREPPATTAGALARLARQAAEHLTGVDRLALRCCPERDCRAVFLDPPGRRRWCPSPACASRGRVRAMRARRTASVAGGGDQEDGERGRRQS